MAIKISTIILFFAAIVFIAIVVASPQQQPSIDGTWIYESDIGNLVFVFNSDGYGTSEVFGQTSIFTYSITNDTILIKYSNSNHITKYPYKKTGFNKLLINIQGIEGVYLSFDRKWI